MLALALCLFVVKNISAQSVSFQSNEDLSLEQWGALMYHDETVGQRVDGYFFFYAEGKPDKREQTYVLSILDEDLNEVNVNRFKEDKRSELVDAAYNGNNILLKFLDNREDVMSYLFFDIKGNLLVRKDYPSTQGVIYPIENEGFVEYLQNDRDRRFKVRYFSNVNNPQWSDAAWIYKDPEDNNQWRYHGHLTTTEDYIINGLFEKPSRGSSRAEFGIHALRKATGEEVFRTQLKDEFNSAPLMAYFDEDERTINVVGLYYDKEAKVLNDNGKGLFKYKLSLEGEIIDRSYLAWKPAFKDFLTIDEKGMVEVYDDEGYLYLHNIVRQADGSYLAIMEQYRKVADAGGIFFSVLSSAVGGPTTSTTNMRISHFVLIQFNSDFTVRDVSSIKKQPFDVPIPDGWDWSNVHLTAVYVDEIGGFDYLFTTENLKDQTTSIGYVDFDEEDNAKGQLYFKSAEIRPEGLEVKEIPYGDPGDKVSRALLPAKPGHILIIEWNEDATAFEVYLEAMPE
jgi:hypothetical protein